jgi:hypothetical protein
MIKLKNVVRPEFEGYSLVWRGLRNFETHIPAGYSHLAIGQLYHVEHRFPAHTHGFGEVAMVKIVKHDIAVYIDRFIEPVGGYSNELLTGEK